MRFAEISLLGRRMIRKRWKRGLLKWVLCVVVIICVLAFVIELCVHVAHRLRRYLLILNKIGRRSPTQTTLLVLYLFIACPSALFRILRGQFGCWVAFLAIVANLFFPQTFQFSRFTLFVVAPETVANGLRDDIASGISCLLIGIILLATEIWQTGGLANCRCTVHCFGYYFGIALLLLFAILYVCLGNW